MDVESGMNASVLAADLSPDATSKRQAVRESERQAREWATSCQQKAARLRKKALLRPARSNGRRKLMAQARQLDSMAADAIRPQLNAARQQMARTKPTMGKPAIFR